LTHLLCFESQIRPPQAARRPPKATGGREGERRSPKAAKKGRRRRPQGGDVLETLLMLLSCSRTRLAFRSARARFSGQQHLKWVPQGPPAWQKTAHNRGRDRLLPHCSSAVARAAPFRAKETAGPPLWRAQRCAASREGRDATRARARAARVASRAVSAPP
jgi:hypothetical protein